MTTAWYAVLAAFAMPAMGKGAELAARNLPADERVLFFMGQDSDTLTAYKQEVLDRRADAPRPGGFTLYTTLVHDEPSPADPLDGIARKGEWGAGVTDLAQTMAEYPDAAIAVGVYLSDDGAGCKSLPVRAIAGRGDVPVEVVAKYRASVDELVRRLKDTGRRVFLRIGYEFDGPWNCYEAGAYRDAFRHIRSRIDALQAHRVATVWQSAAWPRDEPMKLPDSPLTISAPDHLHAWYPGDDAVDWVALSTFHGRHYCETQWSCAPRSHARPFNTAEPFEVYERVLDFARARGKPVMIAEAAPQGSHHAAKTVSCIFKRDERAVPSAQLWELWFAGWFAFIESNRDVIRAVAYINAFWDSQGLWHCEPGAWGASPGCLAGYWGDSRVQADAVVLERFLAQLRRPLFVQPR